MEPLIRETVDADLDALLELYLDLHEKRSRTKIVICCRHGNKFWKTKTII